MHLTENDTATPSGPVPPYPIPGRDGFEVVIAPGATEAVRQVREEALALGWTEAQLSATTGRTRWPSPEYGLVTYLPTGARVTQVTRAFIQFTDAKGEVVQSLYNTQVQQPWVG
ncbi:MAG: hypothetical protein H6739_31265 [Alphaproteobacteria bacterium]|nr:hypothetical protein [Alphaproteobacteria bacterium]